MNIKLNNIVRYGYLNGNCHFSLTESALLSALLSGSLSPLKTRHMREVLPRIDAALNQTWKVQAVFFKLYCSSLFPFNWYILKWWRKILLYGLSEIQLRRLPTVMIMFSMIGYISFGAVCARFLAVKTHCWGVFSNVFQVTYPKMFTTYFSVQIKKKDIV